ncbi:polysaccharide biosynthesis/export family protein [Parablastomonas sp. CN1-191]|uniref:polysaccharide biosynthesis/export family protein n=1 Tax=Parablastomonas sp. CN1-191 TaxID=3400908 RepID=UPI003BF82D69
MKLISLTLAAFSLLLGGCAVMGTSGGQLGASGASQVVNESELPAPGRADLVASSRAYLIGPFDQLVVDVFGIPELTNRQVTADAAGRIAFPIAGTIDAAGLTPLQLSQEIARRLKAGYVRDPQVTVNLKETTSQTVTVDGQVTQPGVYPVVGGMTLMKAVATARGVAEYAKLDDVVVLRTVGGQRYAALYNLAAIRRGNYVDPQIYANDTVIVGESRARRLFNSLIQVAPVLTTPLILLLRG